MCASIGYIYANTEQKKRKNAFGVAPYIPIVKTRGFTAHMIKTALEAGDKELLGKVIVTRGASIRGGNCRSGTDSFIETHGLDKKSKLTALELLALSDTPMTRRAILQGKIL